MDNALIIDLVLGAILLLFTLAGAKKGLFKTLAGFVVVLLALLGAIFAARALTDPLTEMVYPMVEEQVVERVREAGGTFLKEAPGKLLEGLLSDDGILSGYGELFDSLGMTQEVRDYVAENFGKESFDLIELAAHGVVRMVVQAAVLLLAFLVLLLLLRLLVNSLNLMFSLPGLHLLNTLGGGLFGLAEGALLLFLVFYLAPRFGIRWFAEHEAGTVLLSFFLHNSPKSLFALLSK